MARRRTAALVVAVLALAGACTGADDGGAETDTEDTTSVLAQAATEGTRPVVPPDRDFAGSPDPEDDGPGEPTPGTLVWMVEIEPADLHVDDPANGLTTAAWIRQGLLESLFGVGPDLSYHPELLAEEPTITPGSNNSVTIDYRLRSGLTWSDGTPLTAEDVAYTHRILIEGCSTEADGSIADDTADGCVYLTGNRIGLDQVTDFEVLSDTEFRVSMASFYPNWRRLYSPVLAAHAHGEDADVVNRRLRTMIGLGGPLPTSGPLRLERWDRGLSMTLVPNETYHGANAPHAVNDGSPVLDAVRIVFEPDRSVRVRALLDGEADLLFERSRPGHETLIEEASESVTVAALASVDFEHWGLNLLNPHLAQAQVREALVEAIDKEALVEAIHGPLLGDAIEPVGLGNSYWLVGQPDYVDHQQAWVGADPARARELLAEAGYLEEADGSHRHPTLGPLQLRVATTGGDVLREQAQEVLIAQLAEAGIEAVADNPPGGRFFQQGPFDPEALAASASTGGDGDPDLWDIAQFSWTGGPWPGAQSGAYRNGSPGNPYGFSNPEFEVEAFECDAVVDDGERADCYNGLDRFVTTVDRGADGLFMIPLFQYPLLLATATDRLASTPVIVPLADGGPLALAADYALTEVG